MSDSETNATAAADREWLAAIFAHETGQPEAAQRLGQTAAARPKYSDLLSLIAQPAPSR